MDVLQILANNGKNLLPEDIELLTAEIDTGDYDDGYKKACRAQISEIQNWLKVEKTSEAVSGKTIPDSVILNMDDLVPKTGTGIPDAPVIPPERIVSNDLTRMRTEKDYKVLFKKYVKESKIINEEFIEKNFTLFKDWERDAMLACIPFSENYLDKYFDTLDHKLIAMHQLFSESFFMKHFSDMEPMLVLSKGVNPWRDKSKRSKQLNVFLRLKGVKL